jgi:hypothetical protein
MKELENCLTAIGFRRRRHEPECWRVMRIGVPVPSPAVHHRRDPANSRALPRWLDRLAERGRPSPYRIARIG